MVSMSPSDRAFEEAITLITEHAYDDVTPVEELLPRLAWKAFAFGLDSGFAGSKPILVQPACNILPDLTQAMDRFHGIFLEATCQDALAKAARNGNVTKLAAAIQLHVACYLDDRSIQPDAVDTHRLEYAVGLATFCLCSSLRLVELDPELAEIYWHEVAVARGDRVQPGEASSG